MTTFWADYHPEKVQKRGGIENAQIRRSDFQILFLQKWKSAIFFEKKKSSFDQANIQILFLQSLQKKVHFSTDTPSVILVCTPVISLK